jgi:hypothetical protein
LTEFKQEVRHFCRNPKCGSKLPKPVSNPREAFCARGCHTSFYLHRCIVCEGPLQRKREDQKVSRKSKCRSAWRAGSGFGRYVPSSSAKSMQETAVPQRSEPAPKAVRTWRIVAGPELSPTSFRFATLPSDDATADRVSRVNRGYWKEACRAAEERAVIKCHHPPGNILGGYKFPDAPVIDLRPPASPAASAPMPIVGDGLDIPEFLLRRPHQNQMRKAA